MIEEQQENSGKLSDAEILACLLFKMIDEGDEACIFGPEETQIEIVDIALMLCDVTRANRLNIQPTPATLAYIAGFRVDLLLHFAALKK